MDIIAYNRDAWNNQVRKQNRWTIPVTGEEIAAAAHGSWQIILTPNKAVPKEWFGNIEGKRVLCLASGGGQQGPILAAAGAVVTVFDNSDEQLARDRESADRYGLHIDTERGDMADLSRFSDASFDCIVHPISNCFAPDVNPVWKECFRVLKPGGTLLAGFTNPILYIFDMGEWDKGNLIVTNSIPYSDVAQMKPEALAAYMKAGDPLEFGHTLEDQIGGQLRAGFQLTGFYEDTSDGDPLDAYIPVYIATRALKPIC